MTKQEALKLALDALQDYVDEYGPWSDDSGAQYVLRVGKEALAQPEHEREAFTAHAMTSAEKAIDVAIKLEREACAEICDGFYLSWIDTQGRYEFMGEGASECAGAIRRRGQA